MQQGPSTSGGWGGGWVTEQPEALFEGWVFVLFFP